MTKINKYLKRFEAYQNGDLNPDELNSFMKDLKHDQEMQAAWKEYLSMMEAFSDKEAVSLRDKLEKSFDRQQHIKFNNYSKNLWIKASAAAIIILAMGTLLYFFCARESAMFNFENQTLMVSNDTIENDSTSIPLINSRDQLRQPDIPEKKEPVKESIAVIYDKEEYQINPVFAELLNSVYRGGWFEMISPEDSVIFNPGDSLVFIWETNIIDSLYFDVLDRNGIVIYKHSSPVKSPWTFHPDLEPAIYMYRFATKEEPVWLGVMVKK